MGIDSWLVLWNMAFMTFHILGIIIATDELIVFRGVGIPPTSNGMFVNRTIVPRGDFDGKNHCINHQKLGKKGALKKCVYNQVNRFLTNLVTMVDDNIIYYGNYHL